MGRKKQEVQTVPGMAPPSAASGSSAKVSQGVAAARPKSAAKAAAEPRPANPEQAEVAPAAATPAPAVAAAPALAPDQPAAALAAAAPAAAPAAAKAKAKAAAVQPGSEVKAEPKSNAKAGPKAQAKGEAKAKAEPKAQTQAKGEAKAQAKAPAAQGAAKAKAKAVAAAPATQAPVQEGAGDGMEAVKRRKKQKKSADEVEHFQEQQADDQGPSQEELRESRRLKAEHDKLYKDLFNGLMHDCTSLSDLEGVAQGKSPEDVFKEVSGQRLVLDKLVAEAEGALVKHKAPRPKIIDSTKLLAQMQELWTCTADSTSFNEEVRQEMLTEKRAELSKAHRWESFCRFSEDVAKLKERCKKKLKENEEIAKQVKAGNDKRRVAGRVAKNKGIEISELDEKSVVSLTVDMPVEITVLSFLYKQGFEKQFGVVIDRPDANKGIGKSGGVAPPPRSLIVHGVDKEAAACAKELRALDLSDKKVCATTAKHASAVMGASQQNAKRLMEEYRGVFVHNERNQVTLYGPKAQVKKCYDHVVANLPSEDATGNDVPSRPPPQAPMLLDKDRARALIGAGGKTIRKIETDTNTLIKVNFAKDAEEDEDAKTPVRITSKENDRACIENAKKQITKFVDGLTTVLVEAEDQVISRLYDGARRLKGGGKGKGVKEGGEVNRSRFAEMRDDSGLTILRKMGKGVLLVGERADVRKWEVVLRECMKEAAVVPELVTLTVQQARLWSTERVDVLKANTKAEIRFVRRGGKGDAAQQFLEVTGGADEVEKAQAEISKMHDQLGHSDTILDVAQNAIRVLSARSAAKVKEVEKKHEVSISLDRQARSVEILGGEANIAEARKELEEVIAAAASVITQEISIKPEEAGIVIGKQGAMVQHIRTTSGIDDLRVTEDVPKKVVLRGSAEAVEAAAKMVNEVLEKARNPPAYDERPGRDNAKGGGKGGSGGEAGAGERSRLGGDKKEGAEEGGGAAAAERSDKRQSSPKGEGKGKEGGKRGGKEGKEAREGSPTSPGQTDPNAKWGEGKKTTKQVTADIKSTELFPSLGGTSTTKKKPASGGAWGKAAAAAEVEEEQLAEEAPPAEGAAAAAAEGNDGETED